MLDLSRQKHLKMRCLKAIAFFIVSLFIPLSSLFAPLLAMGIESEICGDGLEICEEFLSPSEHKRVREQSESTSPGRGKFSVPSANCSLIIERRDTIKGHRFRHDLLAPLTC